MNVEPEITFRSIEAEKKDSTETLVRDKIAKLEQFCNQMSSCRVAVEKAHEHPSSGSPYRVRLDITVPPSHELAVVRNPGDGDRYDPLESVVRDAFDAARRQLIELNDRQNDRVKSHPNEDFVAIVTKLFPAEGYGFLKTVSTGREIYFNRESVANDEFDRIAIGTGVQVTAEPTEQQPEATIVRIVNKPGERVEKGEDAIDPPMGWK